MSERTLPNPGRVRAYPELAAGGYSRDDGTVEFYGRVNALVRPEHTILDYGAGRGALSDETGGWRAQLANFRGRVSRVIGADIDPVVEDNPTLDEAHVISASAGLPVEDASIDLIVSDHTFEHFDDPLHVVREFRRVLRPGGWVCARTPNKWGYIGVAARLVPNAMHTRILRVAQPHRRREDVFPVRYRLNTLATLRRTFPSELWNDASYGFVPEPAYVGRSAIAFYAVRMLTFVTPAPVLMVFKQLR